MFYQELPVGCKVTFRAQSRGVSSVGHLTMAGSEMGFQDEHFGFGQLLNRIFDAFAP